MLLVTHVVVIIRLLWATSGALSWLVEVTGIPALSGRRNLNPLRKLTQIPAITYLFPKYSGLPNCVLLTACPIVTFSKFFSCAAGLPNGTLSLLNGVRATLRLT
jgi:hypothetical protein